MVMALPKAATKENYALLPAGQYYDNRRKPVLGIVLHITAGLQDLGMVGVDESNEGTNKWALASGVEASWNAIADSDDVILCIPDWYTAWQCYKYNSPTVGIEISKLNVDWSTVSDKWKKAIIRNVARYCAAIVQKHDLPVKLSNKAQVDAAIANGTKFGLTYHMWLNPETRSDPGKNFPIDLLLQYIMEELSGEVDMPLTQDDIHDIWAYPYKNRQTLGYLAQADANARTSAVNTQAILDLLKTQQDLITVLVSKEPTSLDIDVAALTRKFEEALDRLTVTVNVDPTPDLPTG